MELAGAVAVVTGGGSGIGRATALRLARARRDRGGVVRIIGELHGPRDLCVGPKPWPLAELPGRPP
jgi:NAD(P)-dependent dehydrogenase (short-subunit alcohol dehydrogenase family)